MANPYQRMQRNQQVAMDAAGTPINDGTGRIVRRGAIVSAPDLANTAATSARNIDLAANTGPRAIGGYEGDAANAATAARLDFRTNPNLRPPTALTPEQFAADASKQRLLSTAGLVPGRNITPETIAKATPAQIAGELAGQADYLKIAPVAADIAAQAAGTAREDAAIGAALAPPALPPASAFAPQFTGDLNTTPPPMPAVPSAPTGPIPAYLLGGGRNPSVLNTLEGLSKPPPAPDRIGETMDINGVSFVRTNNNQITPLPRPDQPPAYFPTPKITTVDGIKFYQTGPNEAPRPYREPSEGNTSPGGTIRLPNGTVIDLGGNPSPTPAPAPATATPDTTTPVTPAAPQPSGPPAAPAAPTAPAAPDLANPVAGIRTKAQRDALPPGTAYVGPDGRTYIKK